MKREDNKKGIYILTLLSLFIFLFVISFTSAFQLNQASQITVSCDNLNCSIVNISVYDSNSILIVDNQPMTSNSYYANYSITPVVLGTYNYYYSDGTNSSSGTFEVTPTGKIGVSTFLWLFLTIITLTFVLGVNLESNWIVFFAFVEILFLGFFIMIYGIDIFKDVTTTRAIGFILWGIAIIGMFKSGEGMLQEGFGR